MKLSILMLAIFCFVWISTCSVPRSNKPGNPEDAAISAWEALDAMYGHVNHTPDTDPDGDVCIQYNPTPAEAGLFAEQFQPEELQSLMARIVAIFPFQQDQLDKCFVLSEIRPKDNFECHACAPALGGAIFLKKGNRWQLQLIQSVITYIGSWGHVPHALKWVQIGADRYGILIERSYQIHGINDAYTILISQINNQINVLWELPASAEDNAGACGEETDPACYHWSSQIEFKPGQHASFYDLILTQSGTKHADVNDSDSPVISFQQTTLFVFLDNAYVISE